MIKKHEFEISGKRAYVNGMHRKFPLENVENGSVAAYNSFFYEFIQVSDDKLENRSPKLLDELELGERYCVVVTTNAGLYRYNTNDIVEVTGFYHKIPNCKVCWQNK